MSKVLENLKYTKDHEWVLINGSEATIGISDHAQKELGEIVYVELPEVGDSFEAHEEIANIESVKAASAIFSPVGGEVSEVNSELEDSPELVNSDSYGAWLCKLTNIQIPSDLMSAEEYSKFLEENK